jgi:hypothetical protein
VPGATERVHLQGHETLGGKTDHLAQVIGVRGLLKKLLKGHSVVGHRRRLLSVGWIRQFPTIAKIDDDGRPAGGGGRGPLELLDGSTDRPRRTNSYTTPWDANDLGTGKANLSAGHLVVRYDQNSDSRITSASALLSMTL